MCYTSYLGAVCCAVLQAMCADYGFRSGAGRLYQDHYGEVPKGVWQLVSYSRGFTHTPTRLCSG